MPERGVLRQRHLRVERAQPAAEHVERQLRAGHVRDGEVEERWRACRRAAWSRIVGAAKPASARQHLGADGLPGLLQVAHRRVDDARSARAGRRVRPAAARTSRRRGCRARRARSSARTETGTIALSSMPCGVAPAAAQVRAQGAGDDGEHDVVDRAAERALDRLEPRRGRRRPTRSGGAGRSRTLSGLGGAPRSPARATRRGPRPRAAGAHGRAADARARRAAPRATPSGVAASSATRVGEQRRASSARAAGTTAGARLALGRIRLEVEEHGHDVDARDRRRPARGGSCRSARSWSSPTRSTSHISHSGLERSSCCENTRPASVRSSSSPPGAGSAVWRTW